MGGILTSLQSSYTQAYSSFPMVRILLLCSLPGVVLGLLCQPEPQSQLSTKMRHMTLELGLQTKQAADVSSALRVATSSKSTKKDSPSASGSPTSVLDTEGSPANTPHSANDPKQVCGCLSQA